MTPSPDPPVPVQTMDFTVSNTLNNTYVFAITAADGYLNPVSGAPVYRKKVVIGTPETINAVVDEYERFIVKAIAYNNSIPDLEDYALSDMTLVSFYNNGVAKSSFKPSEGLDVTLSFAGVASSGNSYVQE